MRSAPAMRSGMIDRADRLRALRSLKSHARPSPVLHPEVTMVSKAAETGGIHNLRGTAKHGDYAYFCGSGPKGLWCSSCTFFDKSVPKTPKAYGRCRKAASLRRDLITEMRPIYEASASCKFYEPRNRP